MPQKGEKTMPEEKCFLTSSVTIGEKVYTLNFDFNYVESLTEQKARECCDFMSPSMVWALRKEGKIVNPLSFD